ncbi:type II toxin-antitoxin system SpoIISA family toxin [Bacillus coreaensis]
MDFHLFAWLILVFVVGNFLFFCFAPLKYHLSLRTLRKALYTLYIGAVTVGLIIGEVSLGNWQFLLTLTGTIIFIDIAVLLTPSILKIWKAEFQYTDYVENIILTNNKIQKATIKRVVSMSDMIQNAGEYFENLAEVETDDKKREQLEDYVKLYTEKFGLIFQIWEVNNEAVSMDILSDQEVQGLNDEELNALLTEMGFMEGIKTTLNRIDDLNTFDVAEELDSYVNSLYQVEIVSLIKDDAMIIPVFMNEKNVLVVLKTAKGELLEVDGVHVTNLIYLYYSYV